MSSKKNFILDTNILMDDPKCVLDAFDDNNIIIPLEVIQELDGIKKDKGNRGYSARAVLRTLDHIIGDKELAIHGVERNDKGGLLRIIYLSKSDIERYTALGYKTDNNDDMIVLSALKIKEEEAKKKEAERIKTVFVSNDYAARIKSVTYDIATEVYKNTRIPDEFLEYNGYKTVIKPVSFFGNFTDANDFVQTTLPDSITKHAMKLDEDVVPNEFILLEADQNDEDFNRLSKNEVKKIKAVYRFKGCLKKGKFVKRNLQFKDMYGNINGKNLEQSCAIDLLMDDDVNVVSMRSPAGGGKTFLSLAVALTKLLKEKNNNYEKIIFLKPTVTVAEEIGFLPGSAEEKLGPYMSSFVDNINTLKKMNNFKGETSDSYEQLIKDGRIEIECISFIRGRSFNDCIIISDENQNVDNGVIKTILSRVGHNCKIICLGDVDQIDAPYLSKQNNGLSHLIRKFKGQEVYGHISLVKCERSKVSELAGQLL